MRVIIETQGRVRAGRRARLKCALSRVLRSIAGVPLEAPTNPITFRRISRFRAAARRTPLDALIENRRARSMTLGLIVGVAHIAFALGNVVLGLISHSVWTFSVGIMIAALNMGKSYLASGALMGGVLDGGPESLQSLIRCRNAGIALALGMIPMAGTIARLVTRGYGGSTSGTLIYTYALYTSILIVVSLVNMVRARREEIVAIKGVRAFNLACALISIFALQTVVLSRVPWSRFPIVVTQQIVESVVGGSVCFAIAYLGIWLAGTAMHRLSMRRLNLKTQQNCLAYRSGKRRA